MIRPTLIFRPRSAGLTIGIMLLISVALSIPAYFQRLGKEGLLYLVNGSIVFDILATLGVSTLFAVLLMLNKLTTFGLLLGRLNALVLQLAPKTRISTLVVSLGRQHAGSDTDESEWTSTDRERATV